MKFRPCNGNCTDTGTHCDGCGRTHEEISKVKKLIVELVDYAKEMEYENTEDYANFVAKGIYYKLEND